MHDGGVASGTSAGVVSLCCLLTAGAAGVAGGLPLRVGGYIGIGGAFSFLARTRFSSFIKPTQMIECDM